jgi:hypothetical protein
MIAVRFSTRWLTAVVHSTCVASVSSAATLEVEPGSGASLSKGVSPQINYRRSEDDSATPTIIAASMLLGQTTDALPGLV